MVIDTISGKHRTFGRRVFVAANAVVVGDVCLGDAESERARRTAADYLEYKSSYLRGGRGRPQPEPPGENAS